MLSLIAAMLVTAAPVDAQVPWVTASDGTVHVACADYGTVGICYDGHTWDPSPVTVPCDTDADCAARNPHVTDGYGNTDGL